MPIGIFTAGKGPLNIGPRQASQDVGILEEIAGIIVVHKGIMADGKIDGQRCQGQEQADKTRAAKRTKLAIVHCDMKTNEPRDCQKKASQFIGTIASIHGINANPLELQMGQARVTPQIPIPAGAAESLAQKLALKIAECFRARVRRNPASND